jgi:hypothetical protein
VESVGDPGEAGTAWVAGGGRAAGVACCASKTCSIAPEGTGVAGDALLGADELVAAAFAAPPPTNTRVGTGAGALASEV